ncbi:unnamed protein product [Clonostachys solani]|uniref:Uncharacterized protein n=1 Tax=Clonostachys solani TaxID=160281 RepID=A0A9N9ZIJ9_9HYPO|nr:unnamed protein product [Clonostachys solani]
METPKTSIQKPSYERQSPGLEDNIIKIDNNDNDKRVTSSELGENVSGGAEETLSSNKTSSEASEDYNYDVIFTREFASAVQDCFKLAVERIAGTRLSWWPSAEPEDKLSHAHIRVYSMPFRGRRFYADIPTSLAEILFPKLIIARESASKSNWTPLNREAVLLHDTTLIHILLLYFASMGECELEGKGHYKFQTAAPAGSSNTGNPKDQATQATGVLTSVHTGAGASGSNSKKRQGRAGNGAGYPRSTTALPGGDGAPVQFPVLFVSANIGPNQDIARVAEPGTKDKQTFESLRRAYGGFSAGWYRPWRAKRPVGVKFYRFQSFHWRKSQGSHTEFLYHIAVHDDMERYPHQSEEEYVEYEFTPKPWQGMGYFNKEVWHYFLCPEDCGNSKDLTSALPIRINGPIPPQWTAFGIHVDERPSVLSICFRFAAVS